MRSAEDGVGGDRVWKIGELARAAGVTVRTLRHYERVGLLEPSRGRGGQRRYGEADVRRLYAVRALRQLGLGLSEIRRLLRDGATDPRSVIQAHLRHVDAEARSLRRLRRRLRSLVERLSEDAPSSEEFLEIMEAMTMFEKYYTPEQLDQLGERAKAFGPERMEGFQREWAELIAAVEAERAKGTDPSGPEVQRLMVRWRELIELFTGGDAGIRSSLQRMYQEEGVERASRGTMSEELSEYVGRAMRQD